MTLQVAEKLRFMKRRLGTFGAVAILLAIAGGAVYAVGLAELDLFSSPNPLTFDAPAWITARHESSQKEMARALAQPATGPSGDLVIANDWTYTAITRGNPQPSP